MTAINLLRRLRDLQPELPVLTGQITSVQSDGTARVEMTGGGTSIARNSLQLATSQRVFLQGGVITGPAPDLPYIRIEI